MSKLLPPHNRSVGSVAKEEGIADVTLYSWLKQCQKKQCLCSVTVITGKTGPPEAKLAVVVETASMSEAKLSAYCGEKGLYP